MFKRTLLPAFLALLLAPSLALAGDLEDAQALQEAGKYEEALPKFKKAVDAAPEDPAAAQGLSEVLAGLGRYGAAVKAVSQALKAHPEHVGLLLARARAYMLQADQAAAEGQDGSIILAHAADADKWVKKALSVEADNADAGVLKAKVIQHSGGSDEAAAHLEGVAAKNPDHFDTHWELGQHYFRKARAEKSQEAWAAGEKWFSRAAEIDPKSGWAVLNATYAKAWQRKPAPELAKGYERAAFLLPGNKKVLGQLYSATKFDAKECVAAFVRLETARPDDADVGKQVFYNAADPRMSAESYISCASCHVDGGHDGRVWDFTGRGEGLRRTTDLRGRSGTGQGNVHWSANFDEIHDFEHDIRGPFGGTGFLPLDSGDFALLHPSPASGKSGLSAELDALAAYVQSLGPVSVPRSPVREADGSRTAAALNGRSVFAAAGCASCHSGDGFSDSLVVPVGTAQGHDVGTLSWLSGSRLGGPLALIDTPTLHGLHATREFLHHGEAATLDDVFSYAGGELFFVADASLVEPASVSLEEDDPDEGGGGFERGAFGGTYAQLNASPTAGLSIGGIDGGAAGGTARISFRYVRKYGGSTGTLVVNGVSQSITLLRQTPDNAWQTSGWRWATVEVPLNPGTANTIEILRGNGDFLVNVLQVANAEVLAQAAPHRQVLALPAGDQDDLLAYLLTLDGRDDAGAPLPPPPPPAGLAPAIVAHPAGQALAEGNPLSLHAVVSGTGPFTFTWRRNGLLVGGNTPIFTLPAVVAGDAGAYTVTVTNAHGSAVSSPAVVTVAPALAVTTDALPRATVGRPYEKTLEAAGGIDARTWSLAAGTLPVGLALAPNGTLSGTAVAPAREWLTFQVADSSGAVTRQLLLEVRPQGGFLEDPDLVLHYTFDEGSGTRIWDSAVAGNNHSTEVSGALWSAGGMFDGAYGPGDLSACTPRFFPENQGDLDFDPRVEEFTISTWVRTTTLNGYRTIFSKNGGAAENWRVQYRLWTTNPGTNLQGIVGANWSGQLSEPMLNDGQWRLVTLVNFDDAGTWRSRVYLGDGSVFTEWNSGSGDLVPQLLRIADTSNGGNGWDGQLDDLRIYRRALTPAEIGELHNPVAGVNYDSYIAGLPVPPPANLALPGQDADGDGIPNVVEYALLGDLMDAASMPGPTVDWDGSDVVITYPRARPDLIYEVESNADPEVGDWSADGIVQDTATPVGGEAEVRIPVDPQVPVLLVRLAISER